MFDPRKGIVEAVEQRAPSLISRRLAEADCVVLQRLPLDQQEVSVRCLEATPHGDRAEARALRNERPRFLEGCFEGELFASFHVEQGGFQNHHSTRSTERSWQSGM